MKLTRSLMYILLMGICMNSYAAKEGDTHWHPHHISAFAGFSYDTKDREGIKLGLEYIYRISDLLAVRSALDFTGKDYDELSISAGTDFFPIRDVPFYLGIGLGGKSYSEKWKPFTRLLGGYDFHVARLSLSPLIMYDIYEKQNYLTIGLGVGIGF